MNLFKKLKIKYREWICDQYKKYYGSCDDCHYKQKYFESVPTVRTYHYDTNFLRFEKIILRHEIEHVSIDEIKHEFLTKIYPELASHVEYECIDDPFTTGVRYIFRLGISHKR